MTETIVTLIKAQQWGAIHCSTFGNHGRILRFSFGCYTKAASTKGVWKRRATCLQTYADVRGVCAFTVAPRGSARQRLFCARWWRMASYVVALAQRGRKSRRGGQKHKRGASLSTTAPRLGNKPTESSRLAWSWALPFWAVSSRPANFAQSREGGSLLLVPGVRGARMNLLLAALEC